MCNPIYLDHNATTPLLPEVIDTMLPYLREHFGNPSSGHVYGTRAGRAVARAREQVAALLGCEADEVIFTSGGTEANNLAIRGVGAAVENRRHIVTTVIEHPATARPCAWLEKHGRSVTRIGVDADGRVRVDAAREAIGRDTALVTVMHSNNETGVLQPVHELAVLAHAAGALLHTDAAQSLGKVPVNVRDLDVDLLSVAGHKLYAPKGVGALYVKRGTPLVPFTLGASHERGLRPGTENVASIVGLGAA
jgi:cysteine desulfurase